MAFKVEVSSSIEYLDPFYVSEEGQKVIPVTVKILNGDTQTYYINSINLVSSKGAAVSLGEVNLLRTSLSGSPNCIIPAATIIQYSGSTIVQGTTSSYEANIYPQPSPLGFYPEMEYSWDVSAVVNYNGQPNGVSSSAINFAVELMPEEIYMTSPTLLWSLHDNKRPPQYADFDLQLGTYVKVNNMIYPLMDLPYYQSNYSSSNEAVATVVSQSNSPFTTTGSLSTDKESLIVGGAGAVTFTGQTGSVTFSNEPFQPAPTITIKVVDALPVSLQTYPQQINAFGGAQYQLNAYLIKTNGNKEEVSEVAEWKSTNESLGIVDNTGLLSVLSAPPASQFTVYASYEGLEATISVVIQ